MHWISNITEGLANLSVKTVLIAVGAMMIALTMFRMSTRSRDQAADWLVENIQVVLSVVVVVFLIIRPFLFQAFYIPSSSMEPTLMGPQTVNGVTLGESTGDRLLVNKLIYRVSDPQRFDIAVFKAPPQASPDEKEFIKRVIALPGETIEVAGPQLLVDGRPAFRMGGDGGLTGLQLMDRSPPKIDSSGTSAELTGYGNPLRIIVRPYPQTQYDPARVTVDGEVELEDVGGRIQEVTDLGQYGADPSVRGTVYTIDEEPRLAVVRGAKLSYERGHVLVNGKKLIEPYLKETPAYSMPLKKMGPTEYFMMGDNRNNSNDSHVWGSLTRDRIIGRAEILFWPLNRARVMEWWLISVLAGLFLAWQVMQRLLAGR